MKWRWLPLGTTWVDSRSSVPVPAYNTLDEWEWHHEAKWFALNAKDRRPDNKRCGCQKCKKS